MTSAPDASFAPFVDVCLLSGEAPALTYANPGFALRPGDLVEIPPIREIEPPAEDAQIGMKGLVSRRRPVKPPRRFALVWELRAEPPGFPTKALLSKPLEAPFAPEPLVDLCRWIADYYLCPPGVALAPLLGAGGRSSRVRLGLGGRRASPRPALEPGVALPPLRDWHPTPEQAEAGLALEAAVRAGGFAAFLLHGVTGSGKTEVFLGAARTALEAGKQVLILVPEIGLTPQTVRRVRDHLGEDVAVLHSQLTDAERADSWTGLRNGRLRVALGPRSALFAPLFHPGLVVVDEEHDGSYKQNGDSPRYQGRDAAVWLARRWDVPVVLGSATPSLESWQNAREGRYRLLSLPRRATGATLPTVELIDLRRARGSTGGAVSGKLRQALQEVAARGERAMLLHNRRGYAPQMECLDCGHVPECPECPGLRLVWHRDRDLLVCHHCGRTETVPKLCPACGCDGLDAEGWAIQRVEEELRRNLPGVPVSRLDRDVAARRGAQAETLEEFRDRGGILLGTQMIAKGHDFATVTLAAATDADIGSALPDFRSGERTFQLLSQLAGRSGRASLPGRVVLQTRRPDDPLLARIAAHDFLGFAAEELEQRRALRLPPFTRMILCEASGEDELQVLRWIETLARSARANLDQPGIEHMGPIPAPIPVVRRRFRHHFLSKSVPASAAALRRGLASLVAATPPPRGVRAFLDVDPVDLV